VAWIKFISNPDSFNINVLSVSCWSGISRCQSVSLSLRIFRCISVHTDFSDVRTRWRTILHPELTCYLLSTSFISDTALVTHSFKFPIQLYFLCWYLNCKERNQITLFNIIYYYNNFLHVFKLRLLLTLWKSGPIFIFVSKQCMFWYLFEREDL